VLATAFSLLFRGLGALRQRAPPLLTASAAVAAAFATLVVHTLLYAAFLEDPAAWALIGLGLGIGAALAAPAPVTADAASAAGARTRTGSPSP
jgi:putative inorganic carbon (HCO3(-)) transporter